MAAAEEWALSRSEKAAAQLLRLPISVCSLSQTGDGRVACTSEVDSDSEGLPLQPATRNSIYGRMHRQLRIESYHQ